MGTIAQIFESGQHSAKKGIFNNLVMLARVDGKVDETELQLLSRTAKRLSLTPEQVREIIEHPEDYPMVPPVTRLDRCERLVQFVQMMNVDGKIDATELRLADKYGIALGFTGEEMTRIKDVVVTEVQAGKGLDEIVAQII